MSASSQPQLKPQPERQSCFRLLRPLLLLLLVGGGLWLSSPVKRIDTIWSDVLLTFQARPVPEKLLLVTITPEDIISHGTERLSRKFMAEALTLLAQGNVQRVLMDFNLGGGLTSEEERALTGAMQLLGPRRLALAYESDPVFRTKETLLPWVQTVNLLLGTDHDGRMRFITSSPGVAPNPCVWLASGEVAFTQTPLDLRLDTRKFKRVSLGELHSGKVPAEVLNGAMVIIAHDPKVSRSRVTMPVRGISDRGTVLAIGTASCLEHYPEHLEPRRRGGSILFVIVLLSGFLVGLKAPKAIRAFAGILGIVALIIAISCQQTVLSGVPSRPTTLILASLAAMKIALAHRLRVTELFSGLMSGVLSPEEVWLWRVHGERATPVLLFDAMGHIKKANAAAQEQFQLATATFGKLTSPLARQLMPSLGERAGKVTTELGTRRVWSVEWPSNHLPLAICTDETAQQAELEKLQEKINKDPLTGELNRIGFENVLRDYENRGDTGYVIYFLDMNGFKAVNDKYGHAAGDSLLWSAARRFRSVLRGSDQLARFGGDEYAIIVGQPLTPVQAIEFRDRIEATLDERIDIGEARVKVGVAAGFAMPNTPNETMSDVMKRADLAMYERKALLKGERPVAPPALVCELSPIGGGEEFPVSR